MNAPNSKAVLNDRLLDPKEAAEVLACSTSTLSSWRNSGRHGDLLPFIKLGGRIRYRESDLVRFLEECTRTHT